MTTKTQIGCYYFPNYHVDPRNEALYGAKWTEWELVKKATPRFTAHRQPRTPGWGYTDESDPAIFARKINAASKHSITHFIFDWYWYDDGPFLNRALDNGFLGAPNTDALKFCLMWANHDWLDIMPLKRSAKPQLLYPGLVTADTFEHMTDLIVEKYFKRPNYWTIDGCPYFSIYELFKLVEGFSNLTELRKALDRFRRKTKAAGFPDLHLNAVIWGVDLLPGTQQVSRPADILQTLGFDSVTSYVWVHHVDLPDFPTTPYLYVLDKMTQYWTQAAGQYNLPYHPNVTVGWDSSPRTVQSDVFEHLGYPFKPVLNDVTPAAFKHALEEVKAFLDAQDKPHIFNINAWNEWTEGSYLEPDIEYGMAYLEAIRDVFES